MDAATQDTNVVVVGFDGSECARTALAWAAREAMARGADLDVVVAAHVPGMPARPDGDPIVPPSLAAAAQSLADEAGRLLAGTLPQERYTTRVVVGAPVESLVDASAGADLCVVGSRGHGPVTSLVMGSVASAVVGHARCPVAVVRGRTGRGPVVVGVDGTAGAEPALTYAVEAARRSGVPLHVVCAWAMPTQTTWEYAHWRGDLMADWSEVYGSAARDIADRAAARAIEQWPLLEVRTQTPATPAALALADASRDASLVVVGSRDRGRVARFFAGSVGHALVHTARCPVVVCRH
jgi:nucleotide-binding universal stress UspA family protein